MRHRLLALALILGGLAFLPQASAASPTPARHTRIGAFRAAAREYGVPLPVLLSVSYHESLWEDHGGHPSTSGGYGPMHLTHPNAAGTLDRAERLLREPVATLARDPAQNIRGGAVLLARDAVQTVGRRPASLDEWYGAVARYFGGSPDEALRFADAVFDTIRTGAVRTIATGEKISLAPQPVTPDRRTAHGLRRTQSSPAAECPADLGCRFIPAAYALDSADPEDYGNYDVAHRQRDKIAIRYVVIHDTEGSYNAAISTFQNPKRYGSANYVVRSSDGLITQMVKDSNIAWHSGNYYVNMHSIGIEHEGQAIQGATWYSEPLYEASAELVRYLANRFGIPLDRAHILGHEEVPGPTPREQTTQHWDPGPFWDWAHYVQLLGAPLTPSSSVASSVVTVAPSFRDNQPAVSYCATPGSCTSLTTQPSNFLYLHTTPSSSSPLIGDAALQTPGTTQANDWGDKAVTGAQYVLVRTQGDWDAIDYGGQVAWLYSPASAPTVIPSSGTIVTPRSGLSKIPVYGRAYPEKSAYPKRIKKPEPIVTLQYSIPAGQRYVATDEVTSDFYWTPTMTKHAIVRGKTQYYQIFFNHRFAFVRASDVQVVSAG